MRDPHVIHYLDRLGAPFLFAEERRVSIGPGGVDQVANALPKIVFLLEGSLWHQFQGKPREVFRAGSVLVNLRHSVHCYCAPAKRPGHMRVLRITLDPATLRRGPGSGDPDDLVQFLTTRLPPEIVLTPDGSRGLPILLRQIRASLSGRRADRRPRLNALLRLAILECLQSLATGGDKNLVGAFRSEASLLAEKIDDWLEEHLDEAVTLAALARALDRSEEHLARVYRQQRGRTIFEELRRRRIELAKYFLLCTDHPVRLIAERTGFSTQAHFGRIFAQVTGQAPTQFRAAADQG